MIRGWNSTRYIIKYKLMCSCPLLQRLVNWEFMIDRTIHLHFEYLQTAKILIYLWYKSPHCNECRWNIQSDNVVMRYIEADDLRIPEIPASHYKSCKILQNIMTSWDISQSLTKSHDISQNLITSDKISLQCYRSDPGSKLMKGRVQDQIFDVGATSEDWRRSDLWPKWHWAAISLLRRRKWTLGQWSHTITKCALSSTTYIQSNLEWLNWQS